MDVADRTYPARLDGHLDPSLNRWKWLIKWLLVIPHAVVLVFLWIAAVFLTVIAGFAILFTGRYPRGIFDFNLGVMRWTWRVSFYAVSAFGTDRYPPFTLKEGPDYLTLLVRGRYPRDLFALVMGLNRWCYRVLAYAMLMRDEYPPFRLDSGGHRPRFGRPPCTAADASAHYVRARVMTANV